LKQVYIPIEHQILLLSMLLLFNQKAKQPGRFHNKRNPTHAQRRPPPPRAGGPLRNGGGLGPGSRLFHFSCQGTMDRSNCSHEAIPYHRLLYGPACRSVLLQEARSRNPSAKTAMSQRKVLWHNVTLNCATEPYIAP